MGRIEFTNVVIDDFMISRREHGQSYVHILTHIHTDHLRGLSDGWDYGPIYCTRLTAQLLINRFPSLNCLNVLELQTPTVFKMSQTLEVTVTLFQANHCMGAAMVLLEGYMGTVLYTGDIRFNRQIFQKSSRLYPPQKRNADFSGCSIHVDMLYLDNTFLKPKYLFATREQALEMMFERIDYQMGFNKRSRVYIGLDNYGKEEVLEAISHKYQTYIVVSQRRYEVLKATDYDIELFTTNPEEGWCQVVDKRHIMATLTQNVQAVGIILSGWVNHPTLRLQKRLHCIPYSLHSNYNQIHEFVDSIRPAFINGIVSKLPGDDSLFYADRSNSTETLEESNYNSNLVRMKQSMVQQQDLSYYAELQDLRSKYCSRPSNQYYQLMNNIAIQKDIMKRLQPSRPIQFNSVDHSLLPIHMQVVERKPYKLQNARNQLEISRVRNQIMSKKMAMKGKTIELIDQDNGGIVRGNRTSSPTIVDLQEQVRESEVIDIDSDSPTKVKNSAKVHYVHYTKAQFPSTQRKESKEKEKEGKICASQAKQREQPAFKKTKKIGPSNSSLTTEISSLNNSTFTEMRLLTSKEQLYDFFSRHQQLIQKVVSEDG